MVSQSVERFKQQSQIAYIFLFGGIWSYAAFGHSSSDPTLSNGTLFICGGMALIGSVLVALKNSKISNRRLKLQVTLADFFITLILLALIYVIPNFLGLVKAGIILVVEAIYLLIYFRFLDKSEPEL